MCSSLSVSPSSLFFLRKTRVLINYVRPTNSKAAPSASIAQRNLEVSWVHPDQNATDDYNGWAVVESPIQKKNKGLPKFLVVGIGTSIVALFAAIAHFSLLRRGFVFRFSNPLHTLHGMLMPSRISEGSGSKTMGSDASSADAVVSEASQWSDAVNEPVALETNHNKTKEEKLGRIMIPVAVDSIQLEALLMLKKLKIIDDDVKVDELCTRREYARWLVRANSLLERNSKHRIAPSVALSGSTIVAFDDASVEDPDFGSIQSLAEAGIGPSKLSGMNVNSELDDSKRQGVSFFPERLISRQDLINWKAKLDYDVMPGINEEILRTNLGFMDAREISSDALVVLFMDMLAGDKSIIRKVFGRGKRFQPNKPSTKGQAAVALTSGRMTEAINSELCRLEAENSSRHTAMEEIRSELIERGDIQMYWEEKLEEEKSRGFEVERAYIAAVHDFEQEKIIQENTLGEYLKEKAVVDCQKHLLSSLKEEVNEMSERLAFERAKLMDEQGSLQDMITNLQVKQVGMFDAKSILEAEIEALRILRSWIEDEARQSQARAKVLEEAGWRWKWEKRS